MRNTLPVLIATILTSGINAEKTSHLPEPVLLGSEDDVDCDV